MRIQIIIINKFGTFQSKELIATEEQYDSLVESAKIFYTSGGFELQCDDNSFAVFSPEVVKESILKIKKIEDVQE